MSRTRYRVAGSRARTVLFAGGLCASLLLLASCGGGGDAAPAFGGTTTPPVTSAITYTAGVFQPSASFAAQCALPRTGTDPATGRAYTDVKGSVAAENHWLRSWTNELYLWFDEVADRNPAATATTAAFFELQKTTATLASGQPKDRFHFTYDTPAWLKLSQSGIEAGYGAQFAVRSSTPPRKVVVAFIEPGKAAAAAGLTRGAELLTVDGVDITSDTTSAGVAKINAGLFPETAGESHTFTVRDRGIVGGSGRPVTLQSADVVMTPVPVAKSVTSNGINVGYLLFNDHVATAEAGLVNAIRTLRDANVTELVLDIRYNGGGYLDIASELAYMIAGSTATAGRTFEKVTFNSKHPATNPVTGRPLSPTPFYATTQNFSLSAGQALPTLGLSRVVVLTSPGTCSASEAIINGLKGIGVQVWQIGGATCGKPYGFYATDNCGTTYFSIQFKGVNDAGFGDYPEGFSATRSTGAAQAILPGCGVADDFTQELGNVGEAQFSAALGYLNNQQCPPVVVAEAGRKQAADVTQMSDATGPALQPKSPWRENRILRD